MKFNYLFPEVYKKIGWGMFVVFAVLNVLWMTDTIGAWFPCKVISIVPSSTFGDSSFVVQNNGWEDEICMVGMILSLLFISFARLKDEDEYTINLRMKSMAWAFKVFGIVVIVATLTIYGMIWFIVMVATLTIYGMIWFIVMLILVYLIFFLFIGKFYYELHQFRKEAQNEE